MPKHKARQTNGGLSRAIRTPNGGDDESPQRPREIPRRKKDKGEARLSDLPLFAERASDPAPDEDAAPTDADGDKIIQFPGLRL